MNYDLAGGRRYKMKCRAYVEGHSMQQMNNAGPTLNKFHNDKPMLVMEKANHVYVASVVEHFLILRIELLQQRQNTHVIESSIARYITSISRPLLFELQPKFTSRCSLSVFGVQSDQLTSALAR